MTGEPCYTLAEAAKILQRQECEFSGHKLVVNPRSSWTAGPYWICERGCGVIIEFRYPEEVEADGQAAR